MMKSSAGFSAKFVGGLVLLIFVVCVSGGANPPYPTRSSCTGDQRVRTEAGLACGVRRRTRAGEPFVSFKGLPYATQPVGRLRFKELQPLRRWEGVYQATEEGPACPQHDVLYGKLMPGLSRPDLTEACIYANVHVPLEALPSFGDNQTRLPRNIQHPFTVAEDQSEALTPHNRTGLPILVFIHGGGFAFGSGSESLHGPEPFIREKVIVITFNYRLNVFGFLSLNSSSVPGNNGLRDIITLLCWVRRNARDFGGDPDHVTIAGQSAGASAAHLLTLSPKARGLFRRAILMSGTGLPLFFTASPIYAQTVALMFVSALGITTTDPEEIHQQLIDMPLDKIMAVNKNLQDQFGLVVFFPVVESPHPGVDIVIDQDPEILVSKGRGDDVPLLVGYTSNECEVFRPRFRHLDIVKKMEANPLLVLSAKTVFSTPADISLTLAKKVQRRYFGSVPTEDEYIHHCSDALFEYPTLKLARYRSDNHNKRSAPMFMYEFGYQPEYSVLKQALDLHYEGAAHVEDLTFLFNVSSVTVPCSCQDTDMRNLMAKFVTNFMRYSNPVGHDDFDWPPVDSTIHYQRIFSPNPRPATIDPRQKDLLTFFDGVQGAS